jgi:hypothetical protein
MADDGELDQVLERLDEIMERLESIAGILEQVLPKKGIDLPDLSAALTRYLEADTEIQYRVRVEEALPMRFSFKEAKMISGWDYDKTEQFLDNLLCSGTLRKIEGWTYEKVKTTP